MALSREEMVELAEIVTKSVVQSVVKALRDNGLVAASSTANRKVRPSDKSAFQKTEQLLFNYRNFKRIVEEKKQEIVELREHGVPQKSKSIVAYSPGSSVQSGVVLPDEAVESAVHSVECAISSTVQVIGMIDKAMAALKNDPYYEVLEMRYLEGRTLEDIGVHFNCDHSTISRNKNRLVRELAMRLFPDEVIGEYIK